jgi:hypothetical protein
MAPTIGLAPGLWTCGLGPAISPCAATTSASDCRRSGAGRRSAKNADRPLNQSRKRTLRPGRSTLPEGWSAGSGNLQPPMGTALRLVKAPGAGRRLLHHVVSVNAATVAADLAAIATHVDGRIQAATASLGLPAAAPALLQPVRLRRDRGAAGAALGTLVLDVIGDAVTIGWWQAQDAVLALAADRILW